MAEYKAQLSHLKMAPRKVRLVADLVRGGNVRDAKLQLKFHSKRASGPILKLLNSAVSNAKSIKKEDVKEENLFIKKITVDEGPKLKRFRPVARGRAVEIQKKTSHITLILAEQENDKVQNPKPEAEANKPTKLKAKS